MKKCATWWHSIFMSIRESCLLEMSQPSVMQHGDFLCLLSDPFLYGICCIYGDRRSVPCFCRRIAPCGENGRCALCDRSGIIFVVKASGKLFSERGKMAVCRTGRLYAAGIVSGNLCKHGFPGAFIHGDDPVFLVLLSGSGRLELQKFNPSGCWNGSLCTVLL